MKRFAFLCVFVIMCASAYANGAGESVDTEAFTGELVVFADERVIRDDSRRELYSSSIRERFGFGLNYVTPPLASRGEVLSVMLAGGETVDLMRHSASSIMASYAEMGALLDLTGLIDQSSVFNRENWNGMDFLPATSYEGQIYGIPYKKPNGYIPTINKVWLDAIGYDVPSTLDELVDVLRAFRDNRLGGDVTIPMSHQWAGRDQVASLLGMFGVRSRLEVDEGGRRTHSLLSSDAQNALQWVQDAYRENLLDVEWPTLREPTIREKLHNGLVGVFWEWPEITRTTNLMAQSVGKSEDVNMIPFDIVSASPNVEPTIHGHTVVMWSIGGGSPQSQQQAAFSVLEYWNTPEGATLFGLQEGLDFEYQNGKKVLLPTTFNYVVDAMAASTLVKGWEDAIPSDDLSTAGWEIMDRYRDVWPLQDREGEANQIIADIDLVNVMVGELSPTEFQNRLGRELRRVGIID